MDQSGCPHARTLRKRLDLLHELAAELPDGYAALRATLRDLEADWSALPYPCSETCGYAECPVEAEG